MDHGRQGLASQVLNACLLLLFAKISSAELLLRKWDFLSPCLTSILEVFFLPRFPVTFFIFS